MTRFGPKFRKTLLPCHPEPARRGEGPRSCHRRFLGARARGLQLRGPSPSARLRMTAVLIPEVAP